MNRTMRTLALPTALATILALSACGSGSGTTAGSHDTGSTTGSHDLSSMTSSPSSTPVSTASAASGTHNDADVGFATGMIPHHAQAVQMAQTALDQSGNTQIKELATQIKAAQSPEIQTLTGWLAGWGKPVPQPMPGHDMASMGGSMEGMMTQADMQALTNARGTAFDRMWLQMMAKHHQGAVAMSRTELAQGSSKDAKSLAQSIIDGQTKEIAQMADLLAGIPG